MYKNHEGFSDPTAGKAISNAMREYREKQKAIYRRRSEIKGRKKVYVISQFSGNIPENVRKAQAYGRYVIRKRCIPVTSHPLYPQMLDMAADGTETAEARELGTMFGLALLAVCDEAWCFTSGLPEDAISEGMKTELEEARRLGIPIKMIKGEDIWKERQ
ncbi:hypothetical protein D5281_03240 [bacterium 1xD42-62]|uniref:DUF7768 domain-containing protein n=2 Tax=Parablautia muri TaxID=2320879 RepID=A0A9X5GQU6_9FIRM|nr:hypothetical protein [Parablautia muri]